MTVHFLTKTKHTICEACAGKTLLDLTGPYDDLKWFICDDCGTYFEREEKKE